MSKTTDEVKLRNQIVKYSVGSLFKIYTNKTYKLDIVTDPTGKTLLKDATSGLPVVDIDNEVLIRNEMLKMAKERNYIGSTSTDLSLVPPPLVHDLLVKSIETLKKAKTIVIP